MCELLGFTASEKTDISSYLRAFYARSVQHPHGWGMMYEDGVRVILREAVSAKESTFLADFIDAMQPQKILLGHIRFATVGTVREENCHPFGGLDDSGREWTMIHNGTIFHGDHNHRYAAAQQGDTDSERFFLALLDAVNRQLAGGIPTARERFEAVSRFIAEHSPRNKLNLILYDGDLLYVHKNLKNTLYFKRLEHGILFATKPLDSGIWVPFPMTQVIAYRNGQEMFRGERHKGVFEPPLDYITVNDAMYI